ncbi:cyclic nucleotide gated channel 1 [Prunus dulcis]|uniref:Cyclic nucleotide gated channel 1 n=1 Tax=Prunus dulcis TaxID=3755 RepID=A0A4Y1R1C4_PRUDU|nr:cyclic nucleotide gated channel 1 [Prunus dulcis]
MMKRRKETTEQILCAGCCIIVGFLVPIFALITGAIEAIFLLMELPFHWIYPKWRKIFVISCVFAVLLDPLFLYIPIIKEDMKCIQMDKRLSKTALALRSVTDLSYFVDIILFFHSHREGISERKGAYELPCYVAIRDTGSEIPYLNDLCPINSPNMHRSLILVYLLMSFNLVYRSQQIIHKSSPTVFGGFSWLKPPAVFAAFSSQLLVRVTIGVIYIIDTDVGIRP